MHVESTENMKNPEQTG